LWDPFGKGKTIIHAYGGMFYTPMQFGFGLVSNNPDYRRGHSAMVTPAVTSATLTAATC
jgi:hypothetical protein